MLSAIRERTQGLIATLIIGLLAIPFAFWGVNSYFETDSERVVARVGDIKIRVEEFRNALEQQRRLQERQLGGRVDPRMFDSPAFKQQVLDGLIAQMLVAQDNHAAGYGIADAELARQIQQAPEFQRSGRFDPEVYQALLRQAGLGAAGFEQRLREDHMRRQAAQGYVLSAIVTPTDVDQVLRLLEQRRQLDTVTITPERFLPEVKIEPAAVEAHYAAQRDEFRTAERVRIAYLRLSVADLEQQTAIDEADLRRAYQEAVEGAGSREERRARHILIEAPEGAAPAEAEAALERAEDLRRQVQAGADFAALARKHSADPGSAAQGGDLGFVARGVFVPEFEARLYTLKKGEISEPVRTPFGYHLIQLTDVKTPPRPSFASLRPKLERALRARRAQEQFYDLSERFRNLVYEQSDSLAPTAESLGLRIQRSDWFTRSGGSGIAADPRVVDAAFDPEVLRESRNSNAIDVGNDTLVALRIDAHEPPRQRELAEVRDEIERRLTRQAAAERAAEAAADLLARLQAGGSLAALARERGLSVVSSKPVTRRPGPGLDPRLAAAVFAAPRPAGTAPAYGSVDLGAQGVAVYALNRVEDGDPASADPALRDQVRRLLENHRSDGYFANYVEGLRYETKIRTFPDRL